MAITSPRQGIWKRLKSTAIGSSTTAVDTIALAKFSTAKYVLSLYNTTEVNFRTVEMNVLNDGTVVRDTLLNKLFNKPMNIKINAELNGSNMELNIENNETFNIEVVVARLSLGVT